MKQRVCLRGEARAKHTVTHTSVRSRMTCRDSSRGGLIAPCACHWRPVLRGRTLPALQRSWEKRESERKEGGCGVKFSHAPTLNTLPLARLRYSENTGHAAHKTKVLPDNLILKTRPQPCRSVPTALSPALRPQPFPVLFSSTSTPLTVLALPGASVCVWVWVCWAVASSVSSPPRSATPLHLFCGTRVSSDSATPWPYRCSRPLVKGRCETCKPASLRV